MSQHARLDGQLGATKPLRTDADRIAVAADVTRTEYTKCAGNATVVLYTIEGGGHTWPGGGPLPEWFVGPTTHSIDASSVMWEFFKDHPLRRPDQAQAP